jgi:hemerythrin superfamily protein
MAKTTSKTKKRSEGEDSSAIALLKADHREAEDLFEKFEKARSADRKAELAAKVCSALRIHMQIEEEVFYPACRGIVEDDQLDEGVVEHHSARKLIAEIEKMSPDDDLYDARMTVLSEQIDHHVEEEEEEMFPTIAKSDLDLEELGEKLAERKKALSEKAKKAA